MVILPVLDILPFAVGSCSSPSVAPDRYVYFEKIRVLKAGSYLPE